MVGVFSSVSAAAADKAYLDGLVAKSRELRLGERPEWHKLLHYVPNLAAPGVHSLIDNPDFFNAPGGKTDPQAELEATLASFYSELEETAERQNPQCGFIARRAWLDEELRFDRQRLPPRDCKRYLEWHAALNPQGLTLVFAAAYLNNPSSMYGHTLLRIDARDQNERTRLLAYALNFAANTDETNGLLFAVKGLLGGYFGSYSILPYYMKVREYNDMENRDLWEYELDLTPEERERVIRHAWELQSAYFEYYFFDENCSYHLLRLIQVARPEMDLAGRFRWWAIPSDTVRAVAGYPGLVARTVYRPAAATVIRQRLDGMSQEERSLTKELSLGRLSAADARLGALPGERAAAVLEAGYEYVNFRRITGKKDVADPAGLAREMLVARSRVDAPRQTPTISNSELRPEMGHASSRIALGAGRMAGRDFAEARMRPAYHDVLDADEGYVRGAQIEFFSFALRHYREGGTQLESFTPIDIVSLSPRDEFFQSWSWHVEAGWKRGFVHDGSRPLATTFDGGLGSAWSTGPAMLYGFVDTAARAHSSLEKNYSFGAGGRIGALLDVAPRWRMHAYARTLKYFLGEEDTPRALGLEQRMSLGRDVSLRFDLARNREAGQSFNTGTLSLLIYH
jgi:uncharacterized protein DUF4105